MSIPKKETAENPQLQKLIDNARRRAVYQAWAEEKKAVSQGKGSRDWTPEQQNQILKKGRVHDFQGHHMRSVSYGETYQEKLKIAGDKNNIQFLNNSKDNNEHLAAHSWNTKIPTNGYYDVKSGQMHNFGNREPHVPPKENLTNPIVKKTEERHDEYGVRISDDHSKTTTSQTRSSARSR